MFCARIALCIVAIPVAGVAPSHAATSTKRSAVAVSVTVAGCDDTACWSKPRVISYGLATGAQGQPSFELAGSIGRPLLTITY